MLKTLTSKQLKVYDYYKNYFHSNWEMPTYSLAWEDLWVSPSVVHNHIKNLEKIWYFTKWLNWNLSLSSKQSQLPILWKIACWEPIDIYEEEQWRVEVPYSMIWSWNNGYVLIADWDSMKDAGILNGDHLIIKYLNLVEDGDIAVVVDKESFEEKVTLKQVFKTEKWLLCKPKNKVFEPFVLRDTEIRWKLVGVIKHF